MAACEGDKKALEHREAADDGDDGAGSKEVMGPPLSARASSDCKCESSSALMVDAHCECAMRV